MMERLEYSTFKNLCLSLSAWSLVVELDKGAHYKLLLKTASGNFFAEVGDENDKGDYESNFQSLTNDSRVQVPQLSEVSKLPRVAAVSEEGDFNSIVSHDFCDNTTWSASNDSTWELSPQTGKIMYLKKAEVQFTDDIGLNGITELYFDIMAFDPANLPNKMIAQRITYKSIKDVASIGNTEVGVIPACDGLTQEIIQVPFNYPRAIPLESSKGMSVRLSTKNNKPINGSFCTVTFTTNEVDA